MTSNTDDVLSRRKFLIASGAVGVAGLAGCTENNTGGSDGGDSGGSEGGDSDSGGDGSEELSGAIDIAGSSTVFPLATAMAERFQKQNSGVNINIQSTGSGGGFANYFCPGDTDFNNASRPIKGEEENQCADNDVTPIELKVATDALTVVVNNDNDFIGEGLTVEQLQTIFSAEEAPTTWSDVNSEWPDEEIEIFGPTDASGTYDYFIEAIIGEEGPGHRQDYSATEQDRTIIQGVEGSEYAIGYLGFAYYSENTDSVQAVAVENDEGNFVEPSLDTALSGEYNPLSRPLFTYPSQGSLAEEHVAAFARYWMENSTSKEIVADEVGYVPLGDDEQQEMLDKLNAAIEEAN
ncbi:phosphate ABC transporter substrate-binding protein PstS family protein [Haloferax sp. MBLA0076]|uniref:Phosphate ABC transporter substrate-binding protein PstS family protein n=1 Tax=Haloferax litoreum TaxID=2666140 RepID=A0A6A8GFN2_9EURY|nr:MULTISPECIES: PstS family phosphate ABC transporter substrate-binding protein [Haloferax]KAB1193447.1 PstS family phosphate ABC transporter substrate-binding protein [Haloferax sp. CBA1148]MRX21958.1 phosphate ABC transporter substrate-binding protein PstS family protein [Haloferax litoreum]